MDLELGLEGAESVDQRLCRQPPQRCHLLYRGTSLIRKRTPPLEHNRSLDIVLLYGPTGKRFLISEVTL